MISPDISSTILFFAIIGILLINDRKNIQFSYGLVIRKWKSGIKAIDRVVKKRKKIFKKIGNFSIALGLFASFVGVYFLISSIISLTQMFAVVLPSVGGYQYPGPVVSVPFWYWIVGVFVIITTHESMHAIYARTENIPIKSYGIMSFLVIPIGAFVDPDMKKVKKLNAISKLRIYSAGSFANFIVALLVLLITIASTNTIGYFIVNSGVKFDSTITDTPAYQVNLTGIIYQINNQSITNINDLSNTLEKIEPRSSIIIYTTTDTFKLNTIENPENQSLSYIGIKNVKNAYKYKNSPDRYVEDDVINSIAIFMQLLFWLFLLSLGVGIANMLPIKPLDGGLIYEEILTKTFKKNGKKMMKYLSMIILILILFSLFGISLVKIFI